ncbi:MAG: ABC transporter ATP-binding protein, partial [Deltaproteobacteria bacterium]
MLIVDNLSTFYGNFEAIKNVSIAVEKGELVAIIGANGAGKTTLLKTICGLLKPKSGRIFLNG